MLKRSKLTAIIKKTPAAEKENLMEAIVSSYKGKVVVVDFWATWCGPCLDAIKQSESIKEGLLGKNVVFVYITDPSSPDELWKKKILGIDGEHYYLTKEEQEYLSNHFQIEAIPTYLLYDSNGTLKDKIVGFPGTKEMRKKIEAFLFLIAVSIRERSRANRSATLPSLFLITCETKNNKIACWQKIRI